jgi:O-antigen/teichoic acid export membrane protein
MPSRLLMRAARSTAPFSMARSSFASRTRALLVAGPATAEAIVSNHDGRQGRTAKPFTEQLPSLRHNFSWTLAGNIVYAACQWGMLIVLAKLGGPLMVGQFALGLSICAPIMLFAGMSLKTVQASDVRLQYTFADYFGLRLITTGVAVVAVAGVAFATGQRRETAWVILLVGGAKAVESISDIVYGWLQQYEDMRRIAQSLMLRGAAGLMALAGGVLLSGSVVGGAAAFVIAWALVLVLFDARPGQSLRAEPSSGLDNGWVVPRQNRLGRPRWDRGTLCQLTCLALPFGVATVLASVAGNLPRYFIEHTLGERALGIFAALAYLIVAGTTAVSALAQASLPRLARHYTAGEAKDFRALISKLLGIGALLGVVGLGLTAGAGRPLLTLMYGPEYAARTDVLLWLVAAAGLAFLGWFLDFALFAARRFLVLVPLNLAVVAAMIVGCGLFIPGHGMIGAAWATFGAMAVQAVLKGIVVARMVRRLSTTRGAA